MSRAMRDSGIPWIGKIPEHWEVSKLKFYVTIDSGDAISNKQITKEGKYPVYGGGDIMGYYSYYNTTESKLIIGRVGARCGCITMPRQKCWASDNALVLKSTLSLRYTYHLLQAMDLNRLNTSNAQPLITSTKVKNVFIPLTPIEEQQAIADFLDKKCAEIDSLVAVQEQMLEELRAYKQSLITETVTHGLNPSAPMRDSGIPWIGKIPEHWEVKRLKNDAELNPSLNVRIDQDTIVAYMPMECLRNGLIQERVAPYNKVASYTPFKNGDIVMAKVTPCFENGNIAIATDLASGYGFGTSEIFVIRCNKNAYNKYMFYYLQSAYIKNLGISSMTGTGGLKRLNPTTLNNSAFLSPSLTEQQKIADFLDKKCAEIDELIATKQQKIETLKEYKKSIIYEYVTGKKEVADE